jgi:ATP-grasp domain
VSLGATRRPRVALCFEAAGPSPWTIHGGAGEDYEIVWVIDSERDELGSLPRLLQRLGSVVDLGGIGTDEAAAVLAGEGVEGITTHSEGKVVLAARLASRLGLRYFSEEAAQALTDKGVERAAQRAAGVPVPGYWLLAAGAGDAEVSDVADALRYPAVLKPRSANGSRSVMRITSMGELRAALAELAAVQQDMEVIVEEYLSDRDKRDPDFADVFSLETVVADGSPYHLLSSGRFTFAEPFRETGTFLPSAVAAEDLTASMEMADRAIRTLSITDGMMHTEFKLTPDGPRIVETNGIMGGEGIANSLEEITTVNLCRCALDVATGRFAPPALPLSTSGVSYLYHVQPPVGRNRVESVEGIDALGDTEEISQVFLNRPVGSITDSSNGTGEYICSVAGLVPDHGALRRVVGRINAIVTTRLMPLS